MTGILTPEQYERLSGRINPSRIEKRSQGGKQLSYLESWDVRAHLIRTFGYTNFDVEVIDEALVFEGEYEQTNKDTGEVKEMIEVAWRARVRLTLRDLDGDTLAVYTEGSVGSATGPRKYSTRGDLHDNALKTAASDALKRCAINLGNQFGLSLYDHGSTADVVKGTLIKPPGVPEKQPPTDEQAAAVARSLGATIVPENGAQSPEGVGPEDVTDAPGEDLPPLAPSAASKRAEGKIQDVALPAGAPEDWAKEAKA